MKRRFALLAIMAALAGAPASGLADGGDQPCDDPVLTQSGESWGS